MSHTLRRARASARPRTRPTRDESSGRARRAGATTSTCPTSPPAAHLARTADRHATAEPARRRSSPAHRAAGTAPNFTPSDAGARPTRLTTATAASPRLTSTVVRAPCTRAPARPSSRDHAPEAATRTGRGPAMSTTVTRPSATRGASAAATGTGTPDAAATTASAAKMRAARIMTGPDRRPDHAARYTDDVPCRNAGTSPLTASTSPAPQGLHGERRPERAPIAAISPQTDAHTVRGAPPVDEMPERRLAVHLPGKGSVSRARRGRVASSASAAPANRHQRQPIQPDARDPGKAHQRRGWDSNPRTRSPPSTVFKTACVAGEVPVVAGV